MSKSNKHGSQDSQNLPHAHVAEYRIIKHDLIKVVVLNAIYLVAVLSLYFSNNKSHFLDNWFAHLLNF